MADSTDEAVDVKPIVTIEQSAPPPKKRNTANRKERKRTLTMNSAFAELRDHIPNVPTDTKLSKIKTLRLAISYIRYLMEILDDPKDVKQRSIQGFAVDLALQNDAKEKRKRDESSVSVLFVVCLVLGICVLLIGAFMVFLQANELSPRKRGRTGWPQHVWAMELRH